jgi:phosphoglycolate phosphatase
MQQVPPLLVFDLDGTLAETAGDLCATLNVILDREGLPPVALADARKMVGAGQTIEDTRLERLFGEYLAYYEAHIADESHLFDGVVAALDRFEAAGFAFAVCTNKVEQPSVRLLSALGIHDRFKAICGQDTFKDKGANIAKPDPRFLFNTIAQAGGVPSRSVMVGDSRTDIDTAKAAAIPVVAVDFGYTDQPVSTFAPDIVIGHFDELWDAVAHIERNRA